MPTVLCVYVKGLTELQYSNRILVVTSSLVNFVDLRMDLTLNMIPQGQRKR